MLHIKNKDLYDIWESVVVFELEKLCRVPRDKEEYVRVDVFGPDKGRMIKIHPGLKSPNGRCKVKSTKVGQHWVFRVPSRKFSEFLKRWSIVYPINTYDGFIWIIDR